MKIVWLLLFSLNGNTIQMEFNSYEYCTAAKERLADQYREAEVSCNKVILKST